MMQNRPQHKVGDVVTTAGGGGAPWRVESIGPGTLWPYTEPRYRGLQVLHLRSLTSGRRNEQRADSAYLVPWTKPLPSAAITPPRVKGHGLRSEGAPFDEQGARIGWRARGTGRGLCECGALSDVLHSAGLRKRWHREHKDAIRAEQAA